jgi:hypothetical protein
MVKILLIFFVTTLVTACDTQRYSKPIGYPTHGTAVRTNMAAHIIDPRPPRSSTIIGTAHRPVTANERYRSGDIKPPKAVATAPSVSAAEDPAE